MKPTYSHQADFLAYALAGRKNHEHWFEYNNKAKAHPWSESSDHQATLHFINLERALATYTHLEFDHIKIGHLGRRICVFVVKGNQSTVLYDKTKGFPSAKLMASLVLLGSP